MPATQRQYKVNGMSCDHCVNAVSDAVDGVQGVDDVAVDLDSGTVSVAGDGFDDRAIHSAIEDAGYQPAA